jgi:hypothetical protein
MTRDKTVPSPTPASNMRMAGGAGWMLASSSETRLAISVFSLQVETNRRYFCLLSKNRNAAGATSDCGSRLVAPIRSAAAVGSCWVEGVGLLTDR